MTKPAIMFQPVSVMTDGLNREGRLAMADGNLVAVFTLVSAEETGDPELNGGWFLEAGFGPCSILLTITPPVFPSLDTAEDWVRERLASRPPVAS